jgi:hypothetical protein
VARRVPTTGKRVTNERITMINECDVERVKECRVLFNLGKEEEEGTIHKSTTPARLYTPNFLVSLTALFHVKVNAEHLRSDLSGRFPCQHEYNTGRPREPYTRTLLLLTKLP